MGGEDWRTLVPVHSQSAARRHLAPVIGNASRLHRLSVYHNRPEIPPPPRSNFGKTKLRGPLESTKACEKQAKTKLSEAEKLRIGKERAGWTYRLSFQRITRPRSPGFRLDACVRYPHEGQGSANGTTTPWTATRNGKPHAVDCQLLTVSGELLPNANQ
jgi:hypothetical protein